jgi:uncharacterized membrane protein
MAPIIIILLLLMIPFLLVLGFFHIVADSFESFGLSPAAVLGLLLAMLIGSFINIPLGRHRLLEVQESRFFGLVKQRKFQQQGLSLNVGGGVIPVGLAVYLLFRVPLQETMLAAALLIIICYMLARFVPGKGITIPLVFPALFAVIFALILAFDDAAPVAFIAGVSGVLIGGDLLHLPKVMREEQGVMSIGGAGVFDGIFLVAIVAAFLVGL